MSRTPGFRPRGTMPPAPCSIGKKPPRRRADFDLLECRVLPSGVFSAYGIPSHPDVNQLGPLVPGGDGSLVFEEEGASATAVGFLGRVADDGTITDVPLATADGQPVSAASIQTLGPDGNFWGLRPGVGGGDAEVDRVTAEGVVTRFDVGVIAGPSGGGVESIAQGDDGALWFASGSAIGRITVDGVVSSFPLPAGADAREVVSGPDGAIWFTGEATAGRMADDGTVTLLSLPAGPGSTSLVPHAPAFDGDGNLWFFRGDEIDEMANDGSLSRFPISWADPDESSDGLDPGIEGIASLVEGSDGGLWFALPGRADLGRVAPDGSSTLVPLAKGSLPGPVTIGSDGNVWSADSGAGTIGRLTLQETLDSYGEDIDLSAGTSFSGPVAGFYDPNLALGDPGDASSYSASIDWGDGVKSTGVVTANGDGSFAVAGSHDFATEGPYTIAVTIASLAPSSLPAPAATVAVGEASIAVAISPVLFGSTPPFVTLDGGISTTSSPVTSVGIVPPSSPPTPPSPSSESLLPVVDPIAFEGPVATVAPAASGGDALPTVPVVSSSAAILAPTSSPGNVVASSPSATVTPATAFPLVSDPASAASASALSGTAARPSSVLVANASSRRPVPTVSGPKSPAKRPRKQVARPRPVGPASTSAQPPARAVATPAVSAIPAAR